MITYLIKCTEDDCTLVSIVDTNFGGAAENFICEGTYEYCKEIEKKLKDKDDE